MKARLVLTDAPRIEAPIVDTRSLIENAQRIERARLILVDAVPIQGTSAAIYLASRGLAYDGEELRFHPRCLFGREWHPALVALMTDAVTGDPTGVHRTALLPDGSGKASPGKQMLGRASGAVVRLSPDEDVTTATGVAEGVETALATGFQPVWACLSAGTMERFPVLEGIEALTIFADHNPTGIAAANACGPQWHEAGREVAINMPTQVGTDFADLRRVA